MPFDAFVVYETVGRRVRSFKPTQAEVDAAIAADADLSAHVGTVSIPDAAIPGWYFTPADLSFTADAPLMPLDQLKAAARLTHAQLEVWSGLLTAAALTHLTAHVNYGHDILFRGHQAMYLVLHRTPADDNYDAYTIPHRITYCQQMAIGSSDVTDLQSFFEHVHTVAHDHPVLPDSPLTWVDPGTNMRVAFLVIPTSNEHFPNANGENPPPGPALLRDGAWIDDLVA